MKLYSTVCLGFLVVFVCDDKPPTAISDFCQQYKLVRLTADEIDTLSRDSVNQVLANNQKFKTHCLSDPTAQMKRK